MTPVQKHRHAARCHHDALRAHTKAADAQGRDPRAESDAAQWAVEQTRRAYHATVEATAYLPSQRTPDEDAARLHAQVASTAADGAADADEQGTGEGPDFNADAVAAHTKARNAHRRAVVDFLHANDGGV